MSNLRGQVRTAIGNFIASHEGHQVPADILRVIQEEAMLMKETEDVRDALTADPYEQFEQLSEKSMERLKRSLNVTACDRVRCGTDYARIEAVVTFQSSKDKTMALNFLYERQPRRGIPPGENGDYPSQISYIIELSFNHGPRERLLEVQVWSASNVPSTEPAICIQNDIDAEDEEDEDGWEDMGSQEEDENEDDHRENGRGNGMPVPPSTGNKTNKSPVSTTALEKASNNSTKFSPDTNQAKKRQKTGSQAEDADEIKQSDENDDDTGDQYVAFLDPDVLQLFAESAKLLPIHDATAFFLIMTFPFFEHEWDIVGFVLEQFFGDDSDDEDK